MNKKAAENNNKFLITSLTLKPLTDQIDTFDITANPTHPDSNTQRKEARPLNETFLNFFIEKETSFADFEKIYSYYEAIAVGKYLHYNRNVSILNEKRTEYAALLLSVERELLSFVHLTQGNLESYYESTISSLQDTIKQKEHEVICYNNMFKRLYKANYLIEKRLEQEMRYEQLNDAQCEKYNILKNHALLTVTKQTQMLSNVHSFHEMARVKYEDSINAKTKKYNQIDFQVLMIKKDTVEIEKQLKSYKRRQVTVQQEIRKIVSYNKKSKEDNISLSLDYLKMKMKLLEIYSVLKVKGLDDIIETFNLQRKIYQTLNHQFIEANKEVAITNIELTELTKHLSSINFQILQNNRNIPLEYIDDYINKLKKQSAVVASLNEHLVIEIESKINNTKLIIIFLATFIKKMYDSMKIAAMTYGFNIPSCSQSYEKYFTVKNNDVSFNYETKLEGIDYALLYLKIFNEFNQYLFLIFSNSFNSIFTEQLLALNEEYEVMAFNDKSIMITYNNTLRTANTHWDKKEKIYKRGEKDLLNETKTNETQRKKKKKGEVVISKEQLYLSYVKYIKEKQSNSNYIKSHPRRSILLMNKYSNDLVESITKQKKTDGIMTFSKMATIENSQRTNSEPKQCIQEDYDSYTSTPKKKMISMRNKKDYCIKGITAYPEMDKIYSRLNDLRTLELHYFKAKDKHLVSNSNFNEIYYTFKRKFLKDKEKEKEKKSGHNRGLGSFNINISKLPQVTANKEEMSQTSRTHKTSLSISKQKSHPKLTKFNYRANTCSSEYLTTITLRNQETK